ncbi:MAG: helix-turn-helix transcriptional regulator [Massilioclostridium sp.]|nr:helix-turn-helix transcriptional regulator [Massilioclostridium sp.]
MISFEKLKLLLNDKGLKKFYLRQNGISPAIVDKMLNNGDISTVTINKVCKLLDCQPGDIMEYVPDEN